MRIRFGVSLDSISSESSDGAAVNHNRFRCRRLTPPPFPPIKLIAELLRLTAGKTSRSFHNQCGTSRPPIHPCMYIHTPAVRIARRFLSLGSAGFRICTR
ncbi:hypothetical protein RRG08_038638 [Elysia crispata]|uniref:Uncharacterized protein n=1 Tax=Elysia crispata TaxID=231223 RepID=A0AAE0YL59_9GAST|nr:hypothetical protein RRG08_038638 [Elysia crispata]